jgi:deoxyribodipyrimidine photo-lyase
LNKIGYTREDLGEWQPKDAQIKLKRFVQGKLKVYADSRNILADDDGTSHLSPYLRFGLVSARACARLALEVEGIEGTWINELIWRDFYAMVLYRLPEFAKLEFYEKYRGLEWSRDEEMFAKWCEGKTGYPVVDAAMRQLVQTGWMHNRARMIVASFLTKHLLIDWRWGEAFFAQHLMDYELSSNVGGWQWAASTGIDPQPYFRIFNPTSQEKKFDPEKIYIKRYVAEYGTNRYPAPIVKHEDARLRALAFYKKSV